MPTQETPTAARIDIVIAAIAIQYCLGAIYAWSTFTPTLGDAGWTVSQTQNVFSAGLVTFAIVMVLAGRLLPKFGPRNVCMAGGALLGLGYILAGLFGGTSYPLLFVFIGIMGGAGIGLSYVVPIAVGVRWYPHRKGLISGLAVAGFGFGAMLWIKLAGEWGHLLDTIGLGGTFIAYGITFMLVIGIGSLWMFFPPDGWVPKVPAAKAAPVDDGPGLESGAMLRTPQYFTILLSFAFGAAAGLMSIGIMKQFPKEALVESGYDLEKALALAGTAAAVYYALANGLGRIIWGMIGDKLGCKRSIILMSILQGLIVYCFQFMAGTPFLLFIGAALIGFNYGGIFALFPTITAETFGAKHIGQNYGWVFLAYAIGGLIGPVLAGKLGDLGNFPLAFTICGVLCVIAGLIVLPLKRPKAA
jgi:OFA family oxalate/formate antiporter-like MFS transporter